MTQEEPSRIDTRSLVRTIDRRLDDTQRLALMTWAERMLELRNAELPARRKAVEALRVTYRAKVILPVLRSIGAALGDVVWKDRSLSGKLGIAGAGAAMLAFGSQGAGIAALGGAIGVPLWVVFGAGGMFAGQIISELQRSIGKSPPSRLEPADDEVILEADWTIEDPQLPAETGIGAEDSLPTKPLWRTSRDAYREARKSVNPDPESDG